MNQFIKAASALFILALFCVSASYAQEKKVVVIPLGGDDIKGLNFHGPQSDIPQKMVEAAGFSVCHSELYSSNTTLLSTVLTKCNKPELMLACRAVGSPEFEVAAHAPRYWATYETPGATNTQWYRNTEWYYNNTFPSGLSWGFAPGDSTVSRFNCDTNATHPEDKTAPYRMCIDTNNGKLTAGYRCAHNINLSNGWERVFLHR